MKRYQKANEDIHAPEEIKEKAARPQEYARPRWVGAVAAALAAAVIGGAAMHSGVFGDPAADTPTQDPSVPATFSMESVRRTTPDAGSKEDGPSEDGPATYGGGSYKALALSMAEYPEMAPRPLDEDYFSDVGKDQGAWDKAYADYNAAYSAWHDSRAALRSGTDYTGLLDEFLARSSARFLTGADGENRIYSPLNVYMALSMLAETTGGDSRAQILDLLQADSIEALRDRVSTLWKDTYRDDGVVTSILANSLWLKDGMTYSPKTLDTLAEHYYASSFSGRMGSEEYNRALRDWLNEQTKGLLAEQAEGLKMDPATVLALASTIYFKAAWDGKFYEGNNTAEPFHAPAGDVETDFMHNSMDSTYYWGDHFAAIYLGFQDAGGMWLILPDEGYTVDQLLDSGEAMEFLLADKYGAWDEEAQENVGAWPGQKYLTVNLSMPKFDVSSDLDLVEGLKALGVTDVFDMSASNFDPLGASTDDPLYVSTAQHAARVKVDEEGCEAAAYTVIMAECGAAMPPDEEVDFVLDRPFLFAIEDQQTGLPLFVGAVNQPNG